MQSNNNVKRKKSITLILTVTIITALFVCLAMLAVVLILSVSNEMISQQQKQLELLSQTNAQTTKEYMQEVLDQQDGVMAALSAVDAIPADIRNTYLTAVLKKSNSQKDTTLSSFLVYAPNPVYANGLTLYATDGGTGAKDNVTSMLSQAQYDSSSVSTTTLVMDPYKKTIDGREYSVITVITPVIGSDGTFMGAVGNDIDINTLSNTKLNTGGYSSFYNLIICGHKTVISNTKAMDTIGSQYSDVARSKNPQLILDVAASAQQSSFLDKNIDGTEDYRACTPFYVGTSKTVWISATSVSKDEFYKPVVNLVGIVIINCIVTMLILAVLTYIRLVRVLRPLAEIDRAARDISEGKLSVDIKYHSDNEIGSLAESMRNSSNTISGYIADIDRAMNQMSNCNFDLAPSEPFVGDFEGIEKSITRFIIAISKTMNSINSAADEVSAASSQLSNGSNILAQGATEQAGSIEELSTSIEELGAHINDTAIGARSARVQIQQAEKAVGVSSEKMNELSEAIEKINSKSSAIGKIIKTIEDIAFQTNILALNAAVEAARAGAAGKGFAVVADEVRSLAGKSAEAAKNTTVLISETITAVGNGTKLAKVAADSMSDVVREAQTVTKLIDKITVATGEQESSIAVITNGVSQISVVVQTNSATAEESAAAAEELSSQAQILKSNVARFKVKNI